MEFYLLGWIPAQCPDRRPTRPLNLHFFFSTLVKGKITIIVTVKSNYYHDLLFRNCIKPKWTVAFLGINRALARGAILGQWSTLIVNKPSNTAMIPLTKTFRHLSFWVSNKKGEWGWWKHSKVRRKSTTPSCTKKHIICLHDGKLCACNTLCIHQTNTSISLLLYNL